jgi:hypothetical protein
VSGILVRNGALRFAHDHLPEGPALSDVTATIRACDEKFAQFYYELAVDGGLSPQQLRRRTTPVMLQFAAVQLADDLADGDCSYLPDPGRIGAGCQWTLHHLYAGALVEADLQSDTLSKIAAAFVMVGSAQQEEVRSQQWDLARARRAAIGLNGHQHEAYFTIVLAGTPHEGLAPVGRDFGVALHMVGDRVSRDPRWQQLDPPARAALRDDARAAVERMRASGLASLARSISWFSAVLELPVEDRQSTG